MTLSSVSVSELSGAALDWAVGIVEGAKPLTCGLLRWVVGEYEVDYVPGMSNDPMNLQNRGFGWCPRIEWRLGGPILDKHAVWLKPVDPFDREKGWIGTCITSRDDAAHTYHHQHGETPLIAGLRAVVGAISGEVVNIPVALLEQHA